MLTWVEISKSRLLQNLSHLKKTVGRKPEIMAIVKSNAYGHGMHQVANILSSHVDWFGVASLDEAIKLRSSGINNRILVLSFYEEARDKIFYALKNRISLVGYDASQILSVSKLAKKVGIPANIHVKIDSGAGRLGVLPANAEALIKIAKENQYINLEGVFSHFADSENNDEYTEQQMQAFSSVVKQARNANPKILDHIACSAASVLHSKSRLSLVRLGIMLYGLHPSQKTAEVLIQPVMQWKTKIAQVKKLPSNSNVGYGLTYRTKRETDVAIIPVGYADGYDRKFSNRGTVLLFGRKVPIIGRICMNLSMLDVTGIPAKPGDEITLIGSSAQESVTADHLAQLAGTINYEIVTRINWDLPRIVVK